MKSSGVRVRAHPAGLRLPRVQKAMRLLSPPSCCPGRSIGVLTLADPTKPCASWVLAKRAAVHGLTCP
eukprot:3867212-Pyramimonas_sp.AAC.1